MIRLFSLVILTLVTLTVFSQSDKVITLQGDTLTGKAHISTNTNLVQAITLKKGKDKWYFKAYELKSVIIDEETFHTLKVEDKYQLGLLQKEGYLSWYKYMGSEETSSREFDTSILIKRDGTQLIVPNLGFKKQVSKYLEDCPTVSNKFLDKIYKKSDLDLIIEDYNSCIAENTEVLRTQQFNQALTQDKIKKVDTLAKAVRDDGSLTDQENVLEMLKELSIKVRSDSNIPSYLKDALRTSLKGNANFTKQINQILE